MTGSGCKGESTKKHIASKAQRRFFYAVESGKVRTKNAPTRAQARHHIEMGKKQRGELPERAARRGLRRLAGR